MKKWLICFLAMNFLVGCNQARTYLLIGKSKVAVEIADTAKAKEQGLSGRDKLGKNEGMLFIFPQSGIYRFWMKGMKFPLDFIWIFNNQVVGMTENMGIDQTDIRPPQAIDQVLEVNSGWVKQNKVAIGDKIKL